MNIKIKTEKARMAGKIESQQIYPRPQLPWTTRKIDLMREIYTKPGDKGLPVNRRYCLVLNSGHQKANDALRLIKDGLAQLTLQPHGSIRSSCRYLQLTPKGLEYLLQHS